MCNKLIAIIMCGLISACGLTACNTKTENTNTDSTKSVSATVSDNATQNATGNTDSSEKTSTKNETTEADTTSDSTVTPEETTLAEIDDDSYEFVDETVSNPTVAPIEIQEPDETDSSANITEKDLTGTWKPLIATSVADSKEVPFQDIFGSSFTENGGSLVITDGGNFTINMGAAIKNSKSKGTFTVSNYYLLVNYSDNSADTFLYIPEYQNKEVIKTQINDHYIYFYKEA